MGAFRCGRWQSARPLIRLHGLICGFELGLPAGFIPLGLCTGQPATHLGEHPPDVSGVGAHLGFQVGHPGH